MFNRSGFSAYSATNLSSLVSSSTGFRSSSIPSFLFRPKAPAYGLVPFRFSLFNSTRKLNGSRASRSKSTFPSFLKNWGSPKTPLVLRKAFS